MGLYQVIRGVMGDIFQIGGPSGPNLKNGSGILLVRNSTDAGYGTLYALAVRLTGNTPAAGKVWTATNANGDGAWADPAVSGGVAGFYTGDYKLSAQAANHGNWLLCNGAAVSRTTYSGLFSVIGANFGAGDGSTTFNLPDFRGRTAIGIGQGSGLLNRTLGQTVGAEKHSLASTELPAHNHLLNSSSGVALRTANGATGSVTGLNAGSITIDTANPVFLATANNVTAGDISHNNMQPSLAAGSYFIYAG